jgi:chromosome segregation ATPase
MSVSTKPLSSQIQAAVTELGELQVQFAEMAAQQVMFRDMADDHDDRMVRLQKQIKRLQHKLDKLQTQQQLVVG